MKTKLDKMFECDFVRVPRPFVRKFNLNTAVMLSEIYSEYTYWKDRDGLQPGGWFFSTVENMYYNTGLSKHQQLAACKELETYGIIKVKYHGMPKKRYLNLRLVHLISFRPTLICIRMQPMMSPRIKKIFLNHLPVICL